MGTMGQIDEIVSKILKLWMKKSIQEKPVSLKQVEEIEFHYQITIPSDFKAFYLVSNGMKVFFPNDTDDNGFSFYGIERIEIKTLLPQTVVFVFADVLCGLLYYGFRIINKDSYEIGIMHATEDPNDFLIITNSFSEFLELYFINSEKLYG